MKTELGGKQVALAPEPLSADALPRKLSPPWDALRSAQPALAYDESSVVDVKRRNETSASTCRTKERKRAGAVVSGDCTPFAVLSALSKIPGLRGVAAIFVTGTVVVCTILVRRPEGDWITAIAWAFAYAVAAVATACALAIVFLAIRGKPWH